MRKTKQKPKTKRIELKNYQIEKYEEFILENIDEALKTKKEEGYYKAMDGKIEGNLTKRQCKTVETRFENNAFSRIMKRPDVDPKTKLKINDHLQKILTEILKNAEKEESLVQISTFQGTSPHFSF